MLKRSTSSTNRESRLLRVCRVFAYVSRQGSGEEEGRGRGDESMSRIESEYSFGSKPFGHYKKTPPVPIENIKGFRVGRDGWKEVFHLFFKNCDHPALQVKSASNHPPHPPLSQPTLSRNLCLIDSRYTTGGRLVKWLLELQTSSIRRTFLSTAPPRRSTQPISGTCADANPYCILRFLGT